MNELALIIFHKNVKQYPKKWITECVNSIRNQTYQKFDVFELDYGGGTEQIYTGSKFYNNICKDHSEAHNIMSDYVFSLGYKYVLNSNVDDYYSSDRIERQVPYLKDGYDVISSNFVRINEDSKEIGRTYFDSLDIEEEAKKDHNIIAHPVCAYSKHFWDNCSKLRSEEIPKDDFELWKRSYKDFKFVILPYYLLFHRIHSNKVSDPGVWTK